ncbi:MAG: NAD-glutamate dehydrogenase [Spirochaetales bacterium]|nr:NAD-glutamate dehydrogenase [Leptospiraceae bacterium]MCP5479979.1 NAD-glutamate dehydrogenase [Spirochaetales bacterium]MCP5486609.1 NAD-glutamate dehydrogenase [Spirochaetales bacterium]
MNDNPQQNRKKKDPVFADFSETFLFYLPESHKTFYTAEDLDRFLTKRYEFFRERKDEVKIQIYNPGEEFFWLVNSTVLEVALPDSRFIVDTLIDYLNANDHAINLILHPLLSVERDDEGSLTQISRQGDQNLETFIYVEIGRLDAAAMTRVRKDLEANFRELRTIVRDFGQMNALLAQERFADRAMRELADWLSRYFILLGSARVQAGRIKSEHQGIFRTAENRTAIEEELKAHKASEEAREISFLETRVYSRVNQRRPYYLILLNNESGKYVLAGHFSESAHGVPRKRIPIVRELLERIAHEFAAPQTSYTRKEIFRLSAILPVQLLLTRQPLLKSWFSLLLANLYSDEIDHVLVEDEEYSMLWVASVVPRRDAPRIPGKLFDEILSANSIERRSELREGVNRNQFILIGLSSPALSPIEIRNLLEEKRSRVFSSWSLRFRRLIQNKYVGDRNINATMQRYFKGLSPDYEIHQEPEEALIDLDTLEGLKPEQGFRVRYYAFAGRDTDFLKIYSIRPSRLSEMVPVLSNFRFVIDEEYTFAYTRPEDTRYTYAFRLPCNPDLTVADRSRIALAIERVLNRRSTSEETNGLVLLEKINARELDLVKALAGFHFQIDKAFSRLSLRQSLLRHPAFVRSLLDLFEARLGPDENPALEKKAAEACEARLQEIDSILDEGLCRGFLNIVRAIVRTTYFTEGEAIAFKIRSRDIENMPEPVPLFEIYLYGFDIEGTHLRGGMVARGGLRWSDRSDDFRTEILGLMKAQMVKNTVIVPLGSKGGFVIKNRAFENRQQMLQAGQETYKRYIGLLLDLTDNRSKSGKVIPAKGLRRRDGDDPYLVVAADKGTATFSDIANEISTGRNFWLTDAFASGGANGYDHKKQGITARGAWEAVRRHFLEMGLNPDRDPVRTVGIGDMGGDVFGNGMLLSRSIELLAAFNHMYIFIDPNPDASASYEERERLFKDVLNWNDYDKSKISTGGGVFDRSSKRISLSAQARQALGIRNASLSGEELIQAILRAPVDLLWNGGIGTYVKASSETHFQARDPSNDRVRINASELRAKVVGEGGNLGLTQAARVEASKAGVRLNTDAIDNSAGVDMSDHEVNIKILLDQMIRKKRIKDVAARNSIIRKYDADEIKLVLAHNISNNLGLSLDERRVPDQFVFFRALIKHLNRIGLINRQNDNIPFEADLDRIEQGNRKLPRPVLCSLMGFTKLFLSQVFIDSDQFRGPWFDRFIMRYFPIGLVKEFEDEIKQHPLKREIVITEIVNDVINNAGISYYQRMYMRTGRPLPEIAVCYMQFSEFADLTAIRSLIQDPENAIPAEIEIEYLLQLEERVFRINRTLLERGAAALTKNLADPAAFKAILSEARKYSQYRLPREFRTRYRQLVAPLAEKVLNAFHTADVLEDALNVYGLRQRGGAKISAADYFKALEAFQIRELRRLVSELRPESSWEILFLSRLDERIDALTFALLEGGFVGKRSDPRAERALRMIEQIITLNRGGGLSTAAFFEMLEQAARHASAPPA